MSAVDMKEDYINDNVDMLHDSMSVLICLDRGKIYQDVLLDIALKRDQKDNFMCQ